MATLRILAERVHRILSSGIPDADSRFTQKQIIEEIKSVIVALVRKDFQNNYSLEDLHYTSDNYIASFKDITIQYDTPSERKYIIIPSSGVGLPKNRQYELHANVGSRAKFVSVRNEELFVMALQPPVPNIIPYYVEDGKIFFHISPVEQKINLNVRGAIVSGLDDDLTIPADIETEIIMTVMKVLAPELQIPQDKISDGVDNR